MKITIEIENADGLKEIKPVVIDTEIPEFEEFKSPDNFREVFDKYEFFAERQACKVRGL